jgi:putative sigma-54 modulation protein
MKINIKATNIELNDSLRFWLEEKLGELEKFLGVFGPEDLIAGEKEKIEFWVEIGKTTRHHLKGDVFRAEVQLYLPKKSLRAEAVNIDLRTAINEAKDELQREIKRYKEKRLGKARKWARVVKEKFRTPALLRRKK